MRRAARIAAAARFAMALVCSVVVTGCGGCAEPEGVAEQLPERLTGKPRLLLAIHGGGDDPGVWAEDAVARVAPHLPEPERWQHVAWDWTEEAAVLRNAAQRGQREGEAIADALLSHDPPYEHVLIVAHSVGAFVAHGLVERLEERESMVTAHIVLLDPFGMDGVLKWRYGRRRFGRDALIAQSFYNTDDNVPTTNAPLRHAHNVDVTALRPEDWAEDRWHWWPIEAWVARVESGDEDEALRDGVAQGVYHQTWPRGEVTTPAR